MPYMKEALSRKGSYLVTGSGVVPFDYEGLRCMSIPEALREIDALEDSCPSRIVAVVRQCDTVVPTLSALDIVLRRLRVMVIVKSADLKSVAMFTLPVLERRSRALCIEAV